MRNKKNYNNLFDSICMTILFFVCLVFYLVILWFGTYWFEYYECHNEQEFIDSYLNTIKEVMQNKMTFMCYHFKSNNRWYANACYYKDENPEFDDSEDLEKRLETLRNKKVPFNTVIYCFNWEKLGTFSK